MLLRHLASYRDFAIRITDVASRFERGVDVALSLICLFRAHGGCGAIAGDAAQQVKYALDELVDECNGQALPLVQWTWQKRSSAVVQ